MPMSPSGSGKDVFDVQVAKYLARGSLKVIEATRELDLIIKKKHIELAKQCDESHCVISQAITDSQVDCVAASVGHTITKLLFDDGGKGKIVRYNTPKGLRKALIHFDDSKDRTWGLKPGVHTLLVPSDCNKLRCNQSERRVNRTKDAWKSFQQKFKAKKEKDRGSRVGGVNGGSKQRGRQLPSRQVTAVLANGARRKSGTKVPKPSVN